MGEKKLKIAFLSFYSGTVNRGGEVFVHELAKRLSEEHEVIVFQEGPKSDGAIYKTKRLRIKVNWNKRDMTGTIWRRFFIDYRSRKIAIFTLKALPKILFERYDLVISLNGGWQPALVRLVTWLYGGKMVISGQSGTGWDDRNNLWCFPNAFVAISSKARAWAKRANPWVKVSYIPNGVDLKRFKASGPKIKTGLRRPIVLCVAALVPSKRIDLVIRAVARIKNASLLLVGDGYLKKQLKQKGERLLGKRFELIQRLPKEMPAVYRLADVFTLVPESSEAFGIVYLEAMASGLPVVAINDQIRREIIGNVGILIEPEDREAYAEALKEALERNWADKPQKQAEKFSWDKIAENYEKLFLEIRN